MPRSATLSQKIRDERHQQLLNAAARVFAKRGLGATKISDIAAAAGVSHGLVNHYFRSKDELFTAVVERALRGGLQLAQNALDGPGTPWERLETLCRSMVEGIISQPEFLLLIVQVSVDETVPIEARQMLEEYGLRTTESLAALIRAGQQAGEVVAGDPQLLTQTFLACIQGLGIGQVERVAGSAPQLPDPQLILRLLKA